MKDLFGQPMYEPRPIPEGASCGTCAYHKAYDVHYSGPSKIVHYCQLKRAGPSGHAGVTRLKWKCGYYEKEKA